jgi:uncharacterized protein
MRKAFCAALLLFAVACATYTATLEHSRDLYYDASYDAALSSLDKLVAESSDRDHYLLLLERGKVHLAAGNYDSAIVDLQAAERRFLEIESTISVAGAIQSVIVNPTMGEYESEPHEKIMISSYLLLAYWLAGDREGAFVERNRLVGRLEQHVNGLSDEDRARFDVPFARYLAAVMYEIEGRADDARIEYEAINRIMPGTAPESVDPNLRELVVFAEMGRAPVKVSTEIRGYLQKDGGNLVGFFNLPGSDAPQMFFLPGFDDLDLESSGVLFTFAFPRCVKQERVVRSGRLVIDGMEAGEMAALDDLEATVFAVYEKELGPTLIKAAFRTYLKTVAQTKLADGDDGKAVAFDVIGKLFAAVDRADTRSWQTLPAEIAFYRMECPPGTHTVRVEYFGEGGESVGASEEVEFLMREDTKSVVFLP